jgi:phenylpropionate dioxygenase-like ring-hydroxylating dioxygenase large terminal subunit
MTVSETTSAAPTERTTEAPARQYHLSPAVLRRCWHPIAFAADLTDEPVGVEILGEHLMVRRVGDTIAVTQRYCPHRQADLTDGTLKGDLLVCPYHAWEFDGTGVCRRIPAEPPTAPISAKANLRVYTTVVRHGAVWVLLDDESPLTEIPEWPEASDPDYRWFRIEPMAVATSASRVVENFLDVAHFPFVHAGTFGNSDYPRVGDIDLDRTDTGFHFVYKYLAANPDLSALGDTPTIERRMVYDLDAPYFARLAIEYEGGRRHVIYMVPMPVDETHCIAFNFFARNFDHHLPVETFTAFDLAIFNEDIKILERQNPKEIPLDLQASMHVRSDRATVAYRHALRALIDRHDATTH